MSFEIGKPIDFTAAEQLLLRQDVIGNDYRLVGSDLAYGFFFEKTPWIKLSSGVNLANNADGRRVAQRLLSDPTLVGDELAKRNVLFNLVEVVDENPRSKGLEDLPGYEFTDSYGIRPLPGITSMNLRTHNTFGSLRTATVNFVCWSVEQLEVLEVLYMRPGYTVLLEWGHSKYLYKEGDDARTERVDAYAIDFFGSNKKRSTITNLITQQKKKYTYNYDGMYGVVKNFSWTLRPDGGYDCRADIVSTGEIIESYKINIAYTETGTVGISKVTQSPDQTGPLDQTPTEENQKLKSLDELIPARPGQSEFVKQQYGQTAAVQDQTSATVVAPTTQPVKPEKDVPPLDVVDAYKSQLHYLLLIVLKKEVFSNLSYFKTTGYFPRELSDELVTKLFPGNLKAVSEIDEAYKDYIYAIYDSATNAEDTAADTELTAFYFIRLGLFLEIINRTILTASALDEPFFTLETNRTLYKYKTIDDHVSIDPSICLLPDTVDTYLKSEKKRTSQENILDIFVNIDHITSILSNSIDADGEITMYSFFEQLLKDINIATGGLNNFQLQYFEDAAKFAVVDRNVISQFAEEVSQINIIGQNSVVRNFNLTSKLSPRLGQMVSISAQASPYTTGIEGTGLAFFNKGLEDRIIRERNDSQSAKVKTKLAQQQQAEAVEEKLIELEKLVQVQSVIIQLYGKQGGLYIYDDAAVKAARSQYSSYIPYLVGQKNKPAYSFIIPFELELTLEGISGFRIMESFRVNKLVLPYTYRGTETNDIAFLVTGLEHQVNGQAWTTVVRSQIYVIGSKYKTRRHILKDLKEIPGESGPGNARALAGNPDLKQVLIRAGYPAGTAKHELALAIGTKEGWDREANSGRGTRAYRNNNPGNLNYSDSLKQVDPSVTLESGLEARFAHFTTAELGAKALVQKLERWSTGNMPAGGIDNMPVKEKWKKGTPPTLAQTIYTYAPPTENKTEGYIASLIATLSRNSATPITRKTLLKDLLV